MKNIVVLSLSGTLLSLFAIVLITGTVAINIRDIYNRMQHGVPRGVYLGEISLAKKLRTEVAAIVEEESMLSLRRPRNAFFDPQTGQLVRETNGKMIDVAATVEMLMQAEPNTVYSPVKIPLEPEITADVFREITENKRFFCHLARKRRESRKHQVGGLVYP